MSLESIVGGLFDYDPKRGIQIGTAAGNDMMRVALESQRQQMQVARDAANAQLQAERNDLTRRSQMFNQMTQGLNRLDKAGAQKQASAGNAALAGGGSSGSSGSSSGGYGFSQSASPVEEAGVEVLPASEAEIGSEIGSLVGGSTPEQSQVSAPVDPGFNSESSDSGMFNSTPETPNPNISSTPTAVSFSQPVETTQPEANNTIKLSGDAPVVTAETGVAPVAINSTAHKNQVDVPYDGTPANVRYNNPGAAYPRERDNLYGLEGYGVIGGGHLIGKYPSPVHGAASNMDLFANSYKGMTFQNAVRKWRGGNGTLNVPAGYDPSAVIDDAFISDRKRMPDFFQKMAAHESSKFQMESSKWEQAYDMFRGGGAGSSSGASSDFRGKFGNIVTPNTTASRDGGLELLHPEMKSNFSGLMDSAPPEVRDFLRINSAYRTVKDQERIEGGKPRATVASPGKSFHQYGLAIDLGDPNGKLLRANSSPEHKKVVDWLHENAPKHGLNMRLSYHKGGGLVEDWQIEHIDAPKIAGTRNRDAALQYEKVARAQFVQPSRELSSEAKAPDNFLAIEQGGSPSGPITTQEQRIPEVAAVRQARSDLEKTTSEKMQVVAELTKTRSALAQDELALRGLDRSAPNYQMAYNQIARRIGQGSAKLQGLESRNQEIKSREATLQKAALDAEDAAQLAVSQSPQDGGISRPDIRRMLSTYRDSDPIERAAIRFENAEDDAVLSALEGIDDTLARESEITSEPEEETYTVGKSEYSFNELVEFRDTEAVSSLLAKDPKLNARVRAAAGENSNGGITVNTNSTNQQVGTGGPSPAVQQNPIGSGDSSVLPDGSFSTNASAASPEAGSLFIRSIR